MKRNRFLQQVVVEVLESRQMLSTGVSWNPLGDGRMFLDIEGGSGPDQVSIRVRNQNDAPMTKVSFNGAVTNFQGVPACINFNGHAGGDKCNYFSTLFIGQGDRWNSPVVLIGGQGPDTITSSSDDGVFIAGGLGKDLIDASNNTGSDNLDGGGGNDTLISGNGSTSINGGGGNDYIDASNCSWLNLSAGAGNDTLFGNNADGIYANMGDGDDVATGSDSGTSQLFGGAGNDTLTGGSGDYTSLDGGGGNNTLVAQPDVGAYFCCTTSGATNIVSGGDGGYNVLYYYGKGTFSNVTFTGGVGMDESIDTSTWYGEKG